MPTGSGLGELTFSGTIRCSRGIAKPRIFGQWALVYVVGGGGQYRDARGTRRRITAGDWILVFPEMAHEYGPDPEGFWDEIFVCFRGPVFEAWREALYFDPHQPVGRWLPPSKGVPRFARFFSQISSAPILDAVCAWQALLAEILGAQSGPSSVKPEWLVKALDLLEKPSSETDLENVAAAIGMGYESFRKKFEREMEVPPLRYALGRRVEHARGLMSIQQLTNKELASLLGFYDEFHFSKTFARFTGMSPRQFRTELQRELRPD